MLALVWASLAGPALACALQPVSVLGDEAAEPVRPPFYAALDTAIGEDFPGEVQLYRDGMTYWVRSAPDCENATWPWASITKQVVAVLVMQEVERGALELDALATSYLPFPPAQDIAAPTVREVLQHQSGLRNPDDSPQDANGVPDFYSTGPSGVEWCLAGRSAPPAEGWTYNNCDYIVLGAVLESVTGRPIGALIGERFRTAGIQGPMLAPRRPRSLARSDADFPFDISRYGASAGIVGSMNDIIAFDRALLDGRLLSLEARAEMWESDPALGYMALGQWVYDVPLAGCDGAVRIVERRGAIGGYQLRNFILPETEMALVLAVKDENFDFGELWQQQGRSFDILSAAACGDAT
ncbi:serine hydrolase domain-containing protein [Qipengyuania sp. G39]|uniref:Serine hydrolase domain-containing protein n=1 Tax=Qipengyuania profundimaris TaxID=3067652 RepID=A0ABT9HNL2_9SPHN|nr:serine hydrolase domain-containing protein [Qipengyuania sp. G39]MDP4574746.1 serine hydrolase domain-containing protein [Qipengyuania sp. G39]